MRLHELLASLPDLGPNTVATLGSAQPNPEVRGISHDSRRIAAGDLYVAIIGSQHDGRRFAAEAVARGAVAVLGPATASASMAVPWIATEDPRRWLGPLAASLYQHPDHALCMVGITGTNGKSTVVSLLAAMLEAAGQPTGHLGTLGNTFAGLSFAALDTLGRTTPEACDLFRALAAMRGAGARAAVMEVSSHALAQGRVAGATFDAAVFTNLTRDHLDFHGDLEHYFAAKRGLFEQRKQGAPAVINVDDAFGRRLATSLGEVRTFSTDDPAGAEVFVRRAQLDLAGMRAVIVTPRGALEIACGLLGRLNLANVVTAVATAEALGIDHAAMVRALGEQRPVLGRMESIDHGQGYPLLIDFAHTPGALEAALASLGELVRARDLRIAVVFGCGGERDQGKRATMGQVAAGGADLAIATSDNPRGEDPAAILAAVEEGLRTPGGCRYRIEPDRAAAIEIAVAQAAAEPGRWAVLVAGKGHERVQVIGDRQVPFSDHEVVRRLLVKRPATLRRASDG